MEKQPIPNDITEKLKIFMRGLRSNYMQLTAIDESGARHPFIMPVDAAIAEGFVVNNMIVDFDEEMISRLPTIGFDASLN